ncbi:hypothetical protein BTHE_1579 [Bifidobacterium thermophilum]|nr:hypothetical protein BTHE_1579 [Bifidobacterium thermophilum]
MSALEVGNRLWVSGVRVGNGETRSIRAIPASEKETPAVDAAGEERKEREEEKGFNYQEPVFPISCLLTCSIRIHDAVGISKFS